VLVPFNTFFYKQLKNPSICKKKIMATFSGEAVCNATEVWDTAIEWDCSQMFLFPPVPLVVGKLCQTRATYINISRIRNGDRLISLRTRNEPIIQAFFRYMH